VPKDIALCAGGRPRWLHRDAGPRMARIRAALELYGDGSGPAARPALTLHRGGGVRELYAALCRSYEPGDSIYLFGWRRGAATVRALARLVDDCGVIDRDRWQSEAALRKLVGAACAAHRKRHAPRLVRWLSRATGRKVKDRAPAPGGVRIRLLGVWDGREAAGSWRETLAGGTGALVARFRARSLPGVTVGAPPGVAA
jgi:hypothetical protein